jgi:hypothetical protein
MEPRVVLSPRVYGTCPGCGKARKLRGGSSSSMLVLSHASAHQAYCDPKLVIALCYGSLRKPTELRDFEYYGGIR